MVLLSHADAVSSLLGQSHEPDVSGAFRGPHPTVVADRRHQPSGQAFTSMSPLIHNLIGWSRVIISRSVSGKKSNSKR